MPHEPHHRSNQQPGRRRWLVAAAATGLFTAALGLGACGGGLDEGEPGPEVDSGGIPVTASHPARGQLPPMSAAAAETSEPEPADGNRAAERDSRDAAASADDAAPLASLAAADERAREAMQRSLQESELVVSVDARDTQEPLELTPPGPVTAGVASPLAP